ncbi:MAG TPA: response regulator transcription factor [Pyrinomonadaceae bacterium]|nr:response regulator transcription factor [Pyrinomonadaceae bacterium]
MNRIRLILADDHTMFAQGLESLLDEEFELLGTVGNGLDLVDAAQRLNPEVIIVDISMPLVNGFDAVRKIRENGSDAKVIFLTMHDDDTLVEEAFRCGGSGYVLKQAAGEELVEAIKQVAQGNRYVTPLIKSKRAERVPRGAQRSMITPRQREVLKLISQGLTMKQIAAELAISTRTAESHKYEMMEALGIDTTADLIRYALKVGLIS